MSHEPVEFSTHEPSTGFTIGVEVLLSHVKHQVRLKEQVAQGDVQVPLLPSFTHSPSVAVVPELHDVTQYPFSNKNPLLQDKQLLSLYPEHSAQLSWH